MTLGCLGTRKRRKSQVSKRKDKVDETPREADKRKIIETVEGRRTVTRWGKVATKAMREKKDTRGMKPRLGLDRE